MSIVLPSSSGSVIPEYAANNITFMRTMVADASGHLQPSFSVQISYGRVDYLVDGEGNKIATVQRAQPSTPGTPDSNSGWIHLTQEQLIAAGYIQAATPGTVFGFIANMADQLIREDLVKRGILQS
jgi:hypothetical protein